MSKILGALVVIVLVMGLTGCASLVIVDPKGPQQAAVPSSSVPVPVNIEITKSVYDRRFVVTGGAAPVNVSAFNTSIKPGTQNTEVLTTTLMLPPGSYTLTASGTYDRFGGQTQPISTTSSFQVPTATPTLTVSAGSLVLRRNGGSANVNISITRGAGLSGPVVVSVPSPPSGITAGTTTIGPTSTTGQLALTATAGAAYGEQTVTLQATSGGVTATTRFTLRVFHATGPFGKASFALTTPPQTVVSPSNAVRVTARLGTAEGLPSAFAAVYERQGGIGRLGDPIPFNHGQTNVPNQAFGGAGFCAATSTAGFVIAGKGPGVVAPSSVQYVVSVLEFTDPSKVGQADVAAFRSSGTLYFSEPAVYFNSDCTLALAVGADPQGPANNQAQVIDLQSSRVVGSIEFNDPTFSAAVVDVGTRQRIEFAADGQTRNISLP